MRRVFLGLIGALVLSGAAQAAEGTAIPHRHWSFQGFFGTYDRAAAQRGFQVYREVCAACHGLSLVAFRNLSGIGLNAAQIRAVAAEARVRTLNDAGEPAERPGTPADRMRGPYANDLAARAAQNGALPPDLSLITKAREGGADYIVALLTGYANAPAGMQMMAGMNYNRYFAGNQIAMAAPLAPDRVTYADGTRATVEQMASDVAHFLNWAAEPELEARKRMGVQVMLFLAFLSLLLYAVKRKIWRAVH